MLAGMNVALRALAPALAAGDQLKFQRALRSQVDHRAAVGRLPGRRDDDPVTAFQRGQHFGRLHDLVEMRRGDLLLALGHQHQVDGEFLPGFPECMQGGQERRFRPLLVDGPAPHDHLAPARLVGDARLERRARPFGRVHLLHVIHEIDAHGAPGPGVQRGKDAGLAAGRHPLDHLEPGILQQAHRVGAGLFHPVILGGDAGVPDPVLDAGDVVRQLLVDGGTDPGLCGGGRRPGGGGDGGRGSGRGGQCGGPGQKLAAIEIGHAVPCHIVSPG